MTPETAAPEPEQSFIESLVGPDALKASWLKRWLALPQALRMGLAASTVGAVVFLPYLGAVGLWDCWETHYGEVAREMIQRNDYVHPYWENAWFFSKPPMTMWLMALGMQLAAPFNALFSWAGGAAGTGDNALGVYTEWGFRLPSVLFSILALGLLAYAMARTVSPRAGLATAFVLTTMPLYFLLSRQAVTDTPVVSALICAMACAIVGQLDVSNPHRAHWWYAFYVFLGVGMLAKGLLFGIPAVVLLAYALLCVVPLKESALEEHARWLVKFALVPAAIAAVAGGAVGGLAFLLTSSVGPLAFWGVLVGLIVFQVLLARTTANEKTIPSFWAQLYGMRLGTGLLLFAAVCLPWYYRMFVFEQVDDEGKLFWFRFLIHDHFSRLGAGVHTTTPGGDFTYFLEQGGYAMWPWVALIPGAFTVIARLRLRGGTSADAVGVMAVLWFIITFTLMGASATKFHHYVFPMLPPMAILIGMFIDRVWVEGVAKNGAALVIGLPFFILVGKDLAGTPKDFTDLFVYNYDRPYPSFLTERPIAFWTNRPLWVGDLIAGTGLLVGVYLMFEAWSGKRSAFLKALSVLLALVGLAALVVVSGGGQRSPLLLLGLSLVAAAGVLVYDGFSSKRSLSLAVMAAVLLGAAGLPLVGQGLRVELSRAPGKQLIVDPLVAAFIDPANVKETLGFLMTVGGIVVGALALARARLALFTVASGLVLAFTLWFNWFHWVDLSHHWTQRDQFWRYYQQRKPGEPITSFLMNWRGETFYSRNQVKQIKDNNILLQYANQPGREWALVEHARLGILKGAVGADKTVTLIDKDLNNKFVLVTIE